MYPFTRGKRDRSADEGGPPEKRRFYETAMFPLREYQKDAVKAIEGKKSSILDMSCGSGKTRVAMEFVKRPGRVLFLVPNLYLRSQIISYIVKCKKIYMIVTSDYTGHPSSSDKDTISLFVKRNKNCVLICTYQQQMKIDPKILWDLIIMDEAHHLFALKWRKCLKLPYKKRILLTATPFRVLRTIEGTKGLEEFTDSKIDYKFSFRKAIDEGFLIPYNLNIIVLPKTGEFEGLKSEEIGTIKAIMKWNWKKVLIIVNNVESGERIIEYADKNDCFIAQGIFGKTSHDKRELSVRCFKSGSVDVLITCYAIGEGVDIPEIETVVFACRRSSKINIIQNIGRGMRLSRDKSLLNIAVISSDDSEIYDVMKALCLVDPKLLYNSSHSDKEDPKSPNIYFKSLSDLYSYEEDIINLDEFSKQMYKILISFKELQEGWVKRIIKIMKKYETTFPLEKKDKKMLYLFKGIISTRYEGIIPDKITEMFPEILWAKNFFEDTLERKIITIIIMNPFKPPLSKSDAERALKKFCMSIINKQANKRIVTKIKDLSKEIPWINEFFFGFDWMIYIIGILKKYPVSIPEAEKDKLETFKVSIFREKMSMKLPKRMATVAKKSEWFLLWLCR